MTTSLHEEALRVQRVNAAELARHARPRHAMSLGSWPSSRARRYAEAPSSVLSQQRLRRSPSVAAQGHDASAALLGRGHACR